MKADTTKIDGYEEMTNEEKLAALEEKLAALEGHEFDESKLREAVTKANGEAASYKKKYTQLLAEREKEKDAGSQEITDLKEQLAELQKQNTIKDNTVRFASLGMNNESATDSATALAENDAEKLFSNLANFINEHDKDYKAKLLMQTPEPKVGKAEKTTKEKFEKMGIKERLNYALNHPEEYKEFNGG